MTQKNVTATLLIYQLYFCPAKIKNENLSRELLLKILCIKVGDRLVMVQRLRSVVNVMLDKN